MSQLPRRVNRDKTRVEVLAELTDMLQRADALAQTVDLRSCHAELKGAVRRLREQIMEARGTAYQALQLDAPEPPRPRPAR